MKPVLAVEEVGASRGGREIIRRVSFEAARGEIVAVMGLSGGGKTTILRTIAALDPFDRGSIRIDGLPLSAGSLPRGANLTRIRSRVGMVFQAHHLFEHLTAIENVMLAPMHVRSATREEAASRAVTLLESLGVAHRRDAYPRELSGGESQRVAIARAMAMNPPLLLLDEPTASLDPARRFELGQILQKLAAGGCTLVVTTHDSDFVRRFAGRIAVLANGEVVETGRPSDVLDNSRHAETRVLLQRVHDQLERS
ncbi:MAG TPA: ATP-binding cassette domain-containing protein [Thermoanaerobaculia bacterium]|nr:ATP-binding cassette domain-containing protein [Thermoanaerobaculia bacterium]